MELENSQVLINIFNSADIYMLIVVRIIGFLTLLPAIGGKTIPAYFKIGFAMAMGVIIFTSGSIADVNYTDTILGYGLVILKEFFVGFIISYVVYFIFNAIYLAGHLTDQQMGFSMASVFDPSTSTQVPITGNLYYFALCALFIVNRGHHMVISTFFYSYDAIPIGEAYIIGNNGLLLGIVYLMVEFFKIGTLVALPIIGVVLVMDVALGILVRAVPKVNVFVIGMPLKVIAGLLALWIIVPTFSDIYYSIYELVSDVLINSIKVMIK